MMRTTLIIVIVVLAFMLTACQKEVSDPSLTKDLGAQESSDSYDNISPAPDITVLPPTDTPTPTSSESPEQLDNVSGRDTADITFGELAYITFANINTDGTIIEIEIQPDGTFNGQSYREHLDSSSSDYPNGTVYICNFSGRFSIPEKVDGSSYIYNMYAESLTQEGMPGSEKIIDGKRYVNDDPFWVRNHGDVYDFELFLKGTPFDELPESVIQTSGERWDEGETPALYYDVIYFALDDIPFAGTLWNNSGTGKGGRWVDIDWE